MARCGTCYRVSKTSGREVYCSYHGIWVGDCDQACDDYKDNCAIATAVLQKNGIYDKEEGKTIIQALVSFRDEYLMASPKGRMLLNRYHVLGKQIGEQVMSNDISLANGILKVFLNPIVEKINTKDYKAVEIMYTSMVRFLQAEFRK